MVKGVMSEDSWKATTEKDEREWVKAIRPVLKVYRDKVLQRIENNPPTYLTAGYLNNIYDLEPLRDVYKRLIKKQGRKYYDFTKGDILSAIGRKKSDIEDIIVSYADPYLRGMLTYIDQVTAERVVTVIGTERDYAIELIKEGVEQGVAQGLGEREIIKLVQRVVEHGFETTASFRAQRIARTEVASLANRASFEGALNTGVEFTKRWMALADSRTRFSHIMADGQVRGKGETFDIGGYNLMYPCEYGAPAAEVVNCRCRLGYDIRGSVL